MKNSKLFLLPCFILLCACSSTEMQNQGNLMNLSNYKCSQEQLNLVQSELNICRDTNFDSDCFSWAKRSQCDYIGPVFDVNKEKSL